MIESKDFTILSTNQKAAVANGTKWYIITAFSMPLNDLFS
jgi:hypothetical protein